MYGDRKLKDCLKSSSCLYPDGSCYCGKVKNILGGKNENNTL